MKNHQNILMAKKNLEFWPIFQHNWIFGQKDDFCHRVCQGRPSFQQTKVLQMAVHISSYHVWNLQCASCGDHRGAYVWKNLDLWMTKWLLRGSRTTHLWLSCSWELINKIHRKTGIPAKRLLFIMQARPSRARRGF